MLISYSQELNETIVWCALQSSKLRLVPSGSLIMTSDNIDMRNVEPLILVGQTGTGELPSVQEVVLNISNQRQHEGCTKETSDNCEALGVERGVLGAEELLSNEAGAVGSHDVDGHGNGTFSGRLGVQRQPGAIDRI